MYSKNTSKGQWRAHGRYIARESATDGGVGFNGAEESIDIATRLEGWQKARDERLWKLIVSPEFGDRVDPETFDSRSYIAEIEGTSAIPARMGRSGPFQYRAPACSCRAARHRRRSGDQSVSSRDFVRGGHPPCIAEDLVHAPAWASHGVGCR